MSIPAADGYRTIYMDPPWPERGSGKCKRGADRHYELMTPQQILEDVLTSGVWRPDTYGCHLWCWTTNNWMEKGGLFLINALGFKYVTNAVWRKSKAGLGQYMRGRHELLLFATRGRHLGYLARNVDTDIVGAYRGHSYKPIEAYGKIEAVSHGPRLELYARARRYDWDSHGDGLPSRFVRRTRSALYVPTHRFQ